MSKSFIYLVFLRMVDVPQYNIHLESDSVMTFLPAVKSIHIPPNSKSISHATHMRPLRMYSTLSTHMIR